MSAKSSDDGFLSLTKTHNTTKCTHYYTVLHLFQRIFNNTNSSGESANMAVINDNAKFEFSQLSLKSSGKQLINFSVYDPLTRKSYDKSIINYVLSCPPGYV